MTTTRTLTPEPGGLYSDDEGRLYVPTTRGKAAPVVTGYLQVFASDDGHVYSVPGASACLDRLDGRS